MARDPDWSADRVGVRYVRVSRRMVDVMSGGPAIKAIAPWFGGKRTLAPRIVEELGEHSAYWEGGSASLAIILAKKPAAMETVCELHSDAINLSRVLASDRYLELHARLERTLMGDGLFSEAKEICCSIDGPVASSVDEVGPEHITRAYWFMVMSWQGRNGASGTTQSNITIASRFTSNGGSGGFRWMSAVNSVPWWHERLRPVHFKQLDMMLLADRIEDSEKSSSYWDPPYIRKGTKYQHDFVCEVSIEQALADGDGEKEGKRNDHVRLAKRLQRFERTRVVVSYYDEPELSLLYPGWTTLDHAVTKALAHQGKRDQRGDIKKAPEVLLINGPSYAEPENGRLF